MRRRIQTDAGNYFDNYVLQFHKTRAEENPSSGLGRIIRSGPNRGTYRVTKKKIRENLERKYGGRPGATKYASYGESLEHPEILEEFRNSVKEKTQGPESNEKITESVTGAQNADYNQLLDRVIAIPTGPTAAHNYEKAIEALLTAIFYPALTHPIREKQLHNGPKRIDINYTNVGRFGFFGWAKDHYPCPRIFVECKNYTRPLKNPEFDQMSGRFSPSRGRIGLLVYRGYSDKEAVRASCRDTAKDDRGWIIALDDTDLETLVSETENGTAMDLGGLLHSEFLKLTD